MNKAKIAGMLLVLPVVLIVAGDAQAQAPLLLLEGPGSAIGVTVRETTAEEARASALDQAAGVFVESVRSGSPAEKAGLRAGDIVLEFDGEAVRSVRQFTRLVRESRPQRTVAAAIVRGTARQTLQVVPEVTGELGGARNAAREYRLPRGNALRDFTLNVNPGRRDRLLGGPAFGVTVASLSDQLAEYFGVKEGALVTAVASGSPAAVAGLRAGDVITAVAGRSVRNPADVSDALRRVEGDGGVDISVTRDRKSLMLKATMPQARPAPVTSGRRGLPV